MKRGPVQSFHHDPKGAKSLVPAQVVLPAAQGHLKETLAHAVHDHQSPKHRGMIGVRMIVEETQAHAVQDHQSPKHHWMNQAHAVHDH